jgi:erythromycin esterase-like protein
MGPYGGKEVMDESVNAVRAVAQQLNGTLEDYDQIVALADHAHYVLLGEATHGTHEFYRTRWEISKRLIREKGFRVIAVEADWPDAYRVNRYIRGEGHDKNAERALRGFERFPSWMWRNEDVLGFVNWLRWYNDDLPPEHPKVGFYGLDLYSLNSSRQEVIRYLDRVDPQAARRARNRYECFEQYGAEPQTYGYLASLERSGTCEDEVIQQLLDLRKRAADYVSRDGLVAQDEFFYAEQNAQLVKDAEEYYRAMFQGQATSWNIRDRHMADTLDALVNYLSRHGGHNKAIVWAHNSHVGDARATAMSLRGESNIGELMRTRHPNQTALVGFSTYSGTVTAATDWDGPAELKPVRPALPDSFESLFHDCGLPGFVVTMKSNEEAAGHLRKTRLERAIGVIYRPETERQSHYFEAQLADQFDAVIHIDKTTAVKPLDQGIENIELEVPETFPTGI